MRRVYVGLSAPLGYDYKNPIQEMDETGSDVPNPVLENVTGLLLCYDEIWFPSRAFCPRDMHHLPYVRFIDDDPQLLSKALTAVDQFRDLDAEEWGVRTGPADISMRVVESVTSAVPFEMALDNHSRTTDFGMGNAGVADIFLADTGIARALDMSLEVAVNTRLSAAAASLSSLGVKASFDSARLSVAEDLTLLRTVDHLSPDGAYHESVEDLRSHRHIVEFRQYLEAAEVDTRTTTEVVQAANRQADVYDRQVRDRYFQGRGRLYALAKSALGPVGDAVIPGLGTVAKGAVAASEWRDKSSFRQQVAWALFVLDARLDRRAP